MQSEKKHCNFIYTQDACDYFRLDFKNKLISNNDNINPLKYCTSLITYQLVDHFYSVINLIPAFNVILLAYFIVH